MMARYLAMGMVTVVVLLLSRVFAPAAEDRDTILAKAKEEKTLVVYNSMELIDTSALVEAFKKKYPYIDAKLFRLGGT